MGIGVEGENRQCELVKRMSDESTLPWGDASPNSIDRHDGLSDDGEEQQETQIGGPPSGGQPPARKRELDNTNEKSSEWKKRKEIGKDAN